MKLYNYINLISILVLIITQLEDTLQTNTSTNTKTQTNTSTNTKTQTTTTTNTSTNKEHSLMEYMNSFFSTDKKAETVLQANTNNNNNNNNNNNAKFKKLTNKKNHNKKTKKHKLKTRSRNKKLKHKSRDQNSYSFKSVRPSYNIWGHKMAQGGTNGTGLSPGGVNLTLMNDTWDEGLMEDWLMISSPSFRNSARFPPIYMPDGKNVKIEIDQRMFRMNNIRECNMTFNETRRVARGQSQPDEKHENGVNGTNCTLNFYFRLTPQLHIYYSANEYDLNILGSLSIQDIKAVTQPDDPIFTRCGEAFCFDIEDTVNTNWKLCASTWDIAMKWVCRIKRELGQDMPNECYPLHNNTVYEIVEKKITQPIIVIPLPSRHCNDGWNYNSQGDDWECDCKEGVEQSPIDLPTTAQAIDSPVKPLFTYTEISSTSSYDTIDEQMQKNERLKIRLSEHSLRIFHNNFGKVTTLDGAVYFAEEIVIHTPAEHTIDGKKYDMEIQIIHYGATKGDIAKQVILSFLVEKKAGIYNQFVDDLDFFNLPNPVNLERELTNNLFIPKLLYSSTDDQAIAIMKPFSFYTYQGSITSPPCTERTVMYVASKPIQLSTTAIQLFQEALRVPDMVDAKGDVVVSDTLPKSNRNIQEKNGRPVFFYDHEKYCGPDPQGAKPKASGHYEKVVQKALNYFYVNGENPSGLPGAFVVSEKEAKGQNQDYVK